MIHNTFNFSSKDGLELFAVVGNQKKSTQRDRHLIHGLGEHSGRYDHVRRTHQGWIPYGRFDLRGPAFQK